MHKDRILQWNRKTEEVLCKQIRQWPEQSRDLYQHSYSSSSDPYSLFALPSLLIWSTCLKSISLIKSNLFLENSMILLVWWDKFQIRRSICVPLKTKLLILKINVHLLKLTSMKYTCILKSQYCKFLWVGFVQVT